MWRPPGRHTYSLRVNAERRVRARSGRKNGVMAAKQKIQLEAQIARRRVQSRAAGNNEAPAARCAVSQNTNNQI